MAKLLLLLTSLLSAAFEIEAVTVNWPSGYSVDWMLRDEAAHQSLTAKHYFSLKEKSYRWDLFDGETTFIVTWKDVKTAGLYYYFPTTNDTAANVTNCFFVSASPADIPVGPIKNTLPDLKAFTHYENLTVNGLPAQKWFLERSAPGVNNVDTMWLHMGDQTKAPIPIKGETKMRCRKVHSILECTNTFVEYDNYQAQEPDKSIWLLPKDVECRPPSPHIAFILGFIVQWTLLNAGQFPGLLSNQKLFQREIRWFKGLEMSDESSVSASPFPYSDEDIKQRARQLPEMFDWRLHGAVTSVKDQGTCDSSWAFSIAGAMEGAYFRKTGFLGEMSVQALVDCGLWTEPSNKNSLSGCFGGNFGAALDWIKNHGGLPWAADYGDYKPFNGRCSLNNVEHFGPIKGYVHVKADVDAVKLAVVQHGPLIIGISVSFSLFNYENGVFKAGAESGPSNHGALLVGYGSLNGEDYWLIKNSWGDLWGLSGYGLISAKNNTLNLLDNVFYPELI